MGILFEIIFQAIVEFFIEGISGEIKDFYESHRWFRIMVRFIFYCLLAAFVGSLFYLVHYWDMQHK